eukprot:GFUD01102601.1.p1 GENE.GFUD01102601.1~~GFUD01102601.1.p1  ORF type:complete len:647 (-),score=192.59 GFUD01102601.1:563-2503(-)
MGSAIQDQFSLKWKDFHANIATSFKGLRDDDDFLDVTVACDEDKQLQAHKVILSACSPYFRSMLRKNKSQHPVLIMPDSVRFQDVVSLVDFMYHGEVSVPSEELSVFMNTAKQFKVRGLVEDETPRNRQPTRPPIPKPTLPARPQQVQSPSLNVPPDIRQRLPPGIQMVKRPASEASPEKRPRLNPPTAKAGPNPNQNQFGDEEDSGDDITEIREGEDSNDFYEEYPDYEDPNMGYEGEEAPMPPQAGSGPQLMGLLCPNCRQMCQGVQALKEHMQVCKGGQRGQSQPPPAAGGMGVREIPEEPQECHICDKSFKSHRTLDNHMKKQHGLAAPPKPLTPNKGRGRPKKGPMMSDRQGGWQGEGGYGAEGYQEAGQGTSRGRPVGQVAPAQRSTDSPAPSKTESKATQPSTSGDGFRNMPSPRGGRGRGGPQIGQMGRGGFNRPGAGAKNPAGADGAPGVVKPDLQKLGLKFGGQISITSTGNQAKRGNQGGAGADNSGVSVTKLKGDVPVGSPVSIRDAANAKAGAGRATPSQGEASKSEAQADSQVKEEPKEFVDEEEEEVDAEAADAEDFGDYGDGAEGDYIGPGGDGLYGDYGGDDPDQEGMDIEYFSQYKERDEFDGRGGGMFQGEYGEEDQGLEDDYEEEA